MSGYAGIGKINGVAIGSVAKFGGVAKASIWSIGGEQREASIFRVLTPNGLGSYTAGKNSGSFVAVAGAEGQVYFQYDNHSSGDTYNFSYTKTGTVAARKMDIRIATDSVLNANKTAVDIGALNGAITSSSTYSNAASTIYIGFWVGVSAGTLTIDNFIVTKS